MTTPGQSQSTLLRHVIRDVLILVMAEVVVMTIAWCLSARGKAWLERIFRAKSSGSKSDQTRNPIIDI